MWEKSKREKQNITSGFEINQKEKQEIKPNTFEWTENLRVWRWRRTDLSSHCKALLFLSSSDAQKPPFKN